MNGGWLAPEKVREAGKLEMEYLKKQAVYEKQPTSEAFKVTGRRPIPARWLDTDKGDPTKPNFRSRLVVKDIKAAKSESQQLPQNLLFSSTPPLESMRLLCSLMSTQKAVKERAKTEAIGLWDVSRAHFYGIPKRTIYIELPDEDASYTESGEKECGLLMKSMYGTHNAPNTWQSYCWNQLT